MRSVWAAGPHILLGVTGGIAAYKAVDLASKLTAAGAKLQTVMTENACRFVGPKSFEAVTCGPVFTTLWTEPQEYHSKHVAFVEWADLVVVAPATANILGKLAHGICDDLLSTTLCACWEKPILLAPAMNNHMWENPIVQSNVKALKQAGFHFVGPMKGRLACGTEAVGRMAEPQQILETIEKLLSSLCR